jgi:hypothetical protein
MLTILEHVSIGRPVNRLGLSLFPVYIRQDERTIATGPSVGVHITERPDAEVPTLQVHNPTPNPVLLVEGETVTGGRQSRVLNVSVLVPAGATIDIPVSCVEQGRWGGGSEFGRGRMLASRRVRRTTVEGVRTNIERSGRKASEQGAVWHSVREELGRLGIRNETGSFIGAEDVFRNNNRIAAVTEELVAMGPLPGQCGVVVAHGRRVVSADVFANADAFACQWESIIRGAVLDAPGAVTSKASATKALEFLYRVAAGKSELAPGVGLGREHHITGHKVVAQALVWDGFLVHASAFATVA